MRTALFTIFFLAATPVAQAANFNLYPGMSDPNAYVEMTSDKGLIVEIVLRCDRRESGQVKAGIMTYSKVERLFCSSKNRCFRKAEKAADHTCS